MISSLTPYPFYSVARFAVRALFLSSFVLLSFPLQAKTTITYSSTYPLALVDTSSWENDFQSLMDKNGPSYANAFAFANTLGYTIGKATIGTFPSFEAGTSMSAGLTNMSNFKHSSTGTYKGTVPGVGLSPCAHFGVGIGKGFDIVGKFMSFNQDICEIPIPQNRYFNLEKYSLYSMGGKVRYNYVKEKTIIPFLLHFGGITFSAGGDLMRGLVGLNGNYSYEFPSKSVTYTNPATSATTDVTVSPKYEGKYVCDMEWYQFSGTIQAIAYFDIMYFFSLYTGLSGSAGYGWYSYSFDAPGKLTDTSGNLTAYTGSSDIGSVTFKSKTKYHPDVFIPTYIIGLEINIGFFKITTESQVNLANREDVSASFGVRAHF